MAAASPSVGSSRQPPGLYLLFGVEMWERFSYYGMRAFLVLFLVSTAGGFGWSKQEATNLYGWYTGLVYLTPLIGGYLADRVLGTHRALIIGSVVIASGHFCLAIQSRPTFFLGLGLIILGTGFFKSNISTMVGQLYQPNDRRRDAAFTIFYMGINTGAALGPIVCGYLAQNPCFGWHWGFGAAGVGMVLGLVTYLFLKKRYLPDIGAVPADRLTLQTVRDSLVRIFRGRPGPTKTPLSSDDKRGMAAIAVLAFFNIFFWVAFEQAGSSMNFFAEERTQHRFLGMDFLAPYFQSVNPVAIIVLAPLFAWMWGRLAARGREPSTPVKFATGLFLMSASFAIMVVAARLSDGGVAVSPLWLIATYVLQTCGELCLSPVGLSMVTKLAPARFASLMMGMWFLAFFISDRVAGILAGQVERVERGEVFHLLGGQADFFLMFVVVTIMASVGLLALAGPVRRLIRGRA
ncbi:MAG TPA: peptide MFS transporter [Polyangia bacterium]